MDLFLNFMNSRILWGVIRKIGFFSKMRCQIHRLPIIQSCRANELYFYKTITLFLRDTTEPRMLSWNYNVIWVCIKVKWGIVFSLFFEIKWPRLRWNTYIERWTKYICYSIHLIYWNMYLNLDINADINTTILVIMQLFDDLFCKRCWMTLF